MRAPQNELGTSGLVAGRLGFSGGYGAPAAAFEMAFERGCNYFYHGSFRRPGMNQAIKNIAAKGQRDKLIVAAQTYMRAPWLMRWSMNRFFSKTGLEYADVLLLGWWNNMPPQAVIDAALEMKYKGLVRHIAISGHNRPAFVEFAKTAHFDIFHVRYSAAHRGAEKEVFGAIPQGERPGIVTYTATRWGGLVSPGKMPKGEQTPRASDCYRFVLTNPAVNVCMAGPKNMAEAEEALAALDRGPMSADEMAWMRRIGDHLRVK